MTTFTKYVLLLLSNGFFLYQFTVEGKVFSRSLFAKEHQHVSLSDGNFEETTFELGSENRKIREATERSRKRRSSADDKQPLVTRATLSDSDRNHNEAIVHWSGKNSHTMFILTRQHDLDGRVTSSSLYRSIDYGTSFARVTNLTRHALIYYFFVCTNNPKKLLFTDRDNKTLYVTKDEAVTFTAVKLDFSPDRFVFHPSLEDTVLGYSYDSESLYASHDLGSTWTLVKQFVNTRFYWAINGVDKDTHVIHMEVQDARLGGYVYMACTQPYCKDVTVDKSIGTIDYDTLLVSHEYIFVQKTTQFASHLFVSFNRSRFQRAYFPRKNHPKDFSVVSTDDQQVFIAGNHRNGVVNLYVSDTTGRFYVSSLERVLALKLNDGAFHADLYEVRGMKGIYIVNQQTSSNKHIKTLITFDQGGKWKSLPVPLDVNNKPVVCKQVNCSLHLHLKLSSVYFGIPIVLSEDNAPGLIMAQGAMGTYLTPHKSSLYLSRDGGISWTHQFEGNYTHNILDQGGAMVAIKEQAHNLANSILYSCTEGASWQTYLFVGGKFYIDGILNEPGINTLIVSIFGRPSRSANWTIIKMDFTSVLSRKCGSKDYENWTPTDQHKSGKCILGQKWTYKRRLSTSECRNGIDYEKALKTTQCTCTEEDDYVCDYGYKRKDPNCVATSWFDQTVPLIDCPEGTTYDKTRGYRKMAADKCIDNMDLAKRVHPQVGVQCPVVKPGGLDVTMSSKQAVVTMMSVVFHLTQETGSRTSTEYTWDFQQDDANPVTKKGFEKAKNITMKFKKRGLHTVTVTAKNPNGSAKTSLTFMVEDRIRGLYVVTPHGAQVNRQVDFDLEVISDSYDALGMGHVHFIWTFGDESPGKKSTLTWDSHVTHAYKAARNYSVSVEAVNSVSSYFWAFTLPVYDKLVTVQLTFKEDKNKVMVKEDTPMWRRMLDDALRRALADRMFVSEQKLEVVTVKLSPLTVDVSILPSSVNLQMKQLAAQLIAATVSGSVVLTLDPRVFGISNITAVHAIIVSDAVLPPHKARNYLALYICIPILLVAVFFSVLIAVYYKKKLTSLRRYRILGEPSGPDSLLDGTDDDDDDPLLDSGLSESGHRLALSEDADDPLGTQMIGMSDELSPSNC